MRSSLVHSCLKVSTLCALVGLGFTALTAAHVNAQNLVQNGDFETGDFTDWTVSGSNTSVDAGAGVDGSYAASFGALSPDLDTLSQSLNVVAGQQYTLTFSAQTPETEVTGATTGQPNTFSVTFGGNPVTSFSVPDSAGFIQYSYTVTGNATNSILAFDVSNDLDYTQLDNISVTANAPVPEASTTVSFGLLLALGMGSVVIAAKKKASAVA